MKANRPSAGGPAARAKVTWSTWLAWPTLIVALWAAPAHSEFSAAKVFASAPPSARHGLVLDSIEIQGNTRTRDSAVTERLGLRAGDVVDQEQLLAAAEVLRASDLFASLDFHTRPAAERGHIVLVLEVREKPIEVRFGTGNTDLDGWYLIPAELAFDNRLGRGERTRLQLRFGYRHAGVVLSFEQPSAGGSDLFWGCEAAGLGSDRVYFRDGIEYRHHVARSRVGAHLGRQFGASCRAAVSMRLETVEADSTAEVRADNATHAVAAGDELPFDELPGGVKAGVGRSERSVLGAEIVIDSRSASEVAGTPASGVWGRLRAESVFQYLRRAQSFGTVDFDLRGYRSLLGGALAGRLRAGIAGDNAPFYDRLYLGGLYTVRGFPGQSLSDAGGDTWLWSASLEWRAPLIGESARPRLAGVMFVDAGDSGCDSDPDPRGLAVSAGYGLRLRVGWFGWLGLDFGMPLSPSPIAESFRAHASIGWSF